MSTPYITDREKRLHAADRGQHAAKAQAVMRLGLILEYDEDSPPPVFMTHMVIDGKVHDAFWGIAALPSAGDEAGTAAVTQWAAKHHAAPEWKDGRYRAVMRLGGGYLYGVVYVPERVLHPANPDVPVSREAAPELAEAAA